MKFDQKISEEIFRRKYMINGEQDIEQVFQEVAEEIAEAELSDKKQEIKQKFFEEMSSGRFIPGGRILANARKYSKMKNYNNCFTIDIEDSMEGIYGSLQEDAIISSMGGGVGFDISKLRPEGALISKGGESSGPLSFLKVFDQSAKVIHTGGGRRSAHIALMDISHPDIEKFITIKQGDKNKELTQFNISVRITDDFINAVENDLDWNLVYQGEVFKVMKARELYELMSKNAFVHNEPGIFNIDTVEKFNNGWWEFKQDRVNPCLTGDTLVAVADGRNAVSIKQLSEEGRDVPVYSKDSEGKTIIKMMRNPRITGYNQEIYEVTLDDGSSVKCTGNHKFLMRDGTFKEAKNLLENDSLRIDTKWKTSWKEIFNKANSRSSDYWMFNDGFKNRMEHQLIYEQLTNTKIQKGSVIHHRDFNSLNNSLSNLQLMTKKEHDEYHGSLLKEKNNPYYKKSDEWKKSFATHLGSTNGKYIEFSIDRLYTLLDLWVKENKSNITRDIFNKICKENNIPPYFKNRETTQANLIQRVNIENGFKHFEGQYDRREYNKFVERLKDSDLNLIFEKGSTYAIKYCEECGIEFKVQYNFREISYCSHKCSMAHIQKKSVEQMKKNGVQRREASLNKFNIEFTKFIYSNNRIPQSKEVEVILKSIGLNDFRTCGIEGYQHYLDSIIKSNYGVEISSKKVQYNSNNYLSQKAKELVENGMTYNHKVVSVKKIGFDTVYNGTVDDVHNFNIIVNKTTTDSGKDKYIMINNLQCGEICMPSYSLCCLGSHNLVAFVKNAFTPETHFDFNSYKKSIKLGVRFLDNVLDRTQYPLKKIEKFSKQWRRIGLGFTGLGDVLAMLGIVYGSDESLEVCEKIAKTLRDESYIASIELAKEKGSFPAIDVEKLLQGNFISQLPSEIKNQIKKYGIRNIALNTCAPTGTTSLSVGQNCSSGIEPIFSLSYDRNIRTGNDEETKKETVYDYAWLKYIEYYNQSSEAELLQENNKPISKPDYFVTSLDVDPYKAIDVQAVFQKYIDHSISKTANLPKGFTYDQYKDLFMYAYKKGLKGFTSFNPEGSISPILIHKEEQKKEDGFEIISNENLDFIERSSAPKRPRDLPCEIHKVTIKDEKFLILVGEYNGTLYEMFVTNITEENNIDTDNHKKGIIRKNGKGDYSLLVINGAQKTMIKNIGKTFNKDYETMTRLISANLRHGIPLEFTVEQLNKDTNFVGFAKSVARVLKKYIKDGEKVKSSMICPDCGSSGSFIYKEGCISCQCGWTRCS